MRKLAWMTGLFLILTISAAAQDFPKFEVFGGYSYLHRNFAGSGFNFNGGNASIAVNPSSWLGFEANFGGYHNNKSGASTNTFTYLFGPKFTYRGNERVTPFFHVLLGGAHSSTTFAGVSSSGNAFTFAPGGGIDVNVSPLVAVRLAQVDYLLTTFKDDEDNRQNNIRVSAGIVFRWGK